MQPKIDINTQFNEIRIPKFQIKRNDFKISLFSLLLPTETNKQMSRKNGLDLIFQLIMYRCDLAHFLSL